MINLDRPPCPFCYKEMKPFYCGCGARRAEECRRCSGSGEFLACQNPTCENCASHEEIAACVEVVCV